MDEIDEKLWHEADRAANKVFDDIGTFGGKKAVLGLLQLSLYNFAIRQGPLVGRDLISAAKGVTDYDWSDNDDDAVEAVSALRKIVNKI